jgi:hypothetical protein
MHGTLMYFTTDFDATKASVQMLAVLEPGYRGPATHVQLRAGNAGSSLRISTTRRYRKTVAIKGAAMVADMPLPEVVTFPLVTDAPLTFPTKENLDESPLLGPRIR